MPYSIKKSGPSGYKVYNKNTGKTYSKKPHSSKKKAQKQLAAIAMNTHESYIDKLNKTLIF